MTKIHTDLQSLARPVEELHELPGNPQVGDVEALATSYDTFGQAKPVKIWKDEDGKWIVIDGNHQLKAVIKLGWNELACSEFVGTREEAMAYALAANRTAALAYTDPALVLELMEEIDSEYLILASGYDEADISVLVAQASAFDGSALNVTGAESYAEREDAYRQKGTRSLVLTYQLDEHAEALGILQGLIDGTERTAEQVVIELLRDAAN